MQKSYNNYLRSLLIQSAQSTGTIEYTDDLKIGPNRNEAKFYDLTPKSKLLSIIDRARDIFAISDAATINDGKFDSDRIREFADFLMNLYPKDSLPSNTLKGIPEGDNTLFWGFRSPTALKKSISRMSLYANRIITVNPLIDDFLYRPDCSPLYKPDVWEPLYKMQLAFMLEAEPWIQNDILIMIPALHVHSMDLMNQI